MARFSQFTYRNNFYPSSGNYPANPSAGDLYKANDAGTVSGISYLAGDYAFYDGSSWSRLDSTDVSAGSLDTNNMAYYNGTDLSLASTMMMSATQLSFYGSPLTAQPASADQTTLTDNTYGSTAAYTLVSVGDDWDGSTYPTAAEAANLNNNMARVAKLVNKLRADLVTLGLIKGEA